jgi:two-component system, cell cycle response regulator CpdR
MARILLAEDDESMRQFLAVALRRAGHEVMVAQDGLEALNVLEGDNRYDLLLTDIVMPGMDGIELAQQASKISPSLKVMFITGFAAVALSGENRGQNQARLLSKPFHLNDLVTQVETLLAA